MQPPPAATTPLPRVALTARNNKYKRVLTFMTICVQEGGVPDDQDAQ